MSIIKLAQPPCIVLFVEVVRVAIFFCMMAIFVGVGPTIIILSGGGARGPPPPFGGFYQGAGVSPMLGAGKRVAPAPSVGAPLRWLVPEIA